MAKILVDNWDNDDFDNDQYGGTQERFNTRNNKKNESRTPTQKKETATFANTFFEVKSLGLTKAFLSFMIVYATAFSG